MPQVLECCVLDGWVLECARDEREVVHSTRGAATRAPFALPLLYIRLIHMHVLPSLKLKLRQSSVPRCYIYIYIELMELRQA